MKRWLAFLEGGLLPIISLTSLHFFVKYDEPGEKTAKLETEDREESKAKRVKAPTPTPVLSNEEYFDELPIVKLEEPLKNMEVVTPEELKERIEKKNKRLVYTKNNGDNQ